MEPLFHLCPFAVALTTAIYPLFYDLYHVDWYIPWCKVTEVKGSNEIIAVHHTLVLAFILILLSLVLLCFGLIIGGRLR